MAKTNSIAIFQHYIYKDRAGTHNDSLNVANIHGNQLNKSYQDLHLPVGTVRSTTSQGSQQELVNLNDLLDIAKPTFFLIKQHLRNMVYNLCMGVWGFPEGFNFNWRVLWDSDGLLRLLKQSLGKFDWCCCSLDIPGKMASWGIVQDWRGIEGSKGFK